MNLPSLPEAWLTRRPGAPLTSSSFPITALAAALALSACSKEAPAAKSAAAQPAKAAKAAAPAAAPTTAKPAAGPAGGTPAVEAAPAAAPAPAAGEAGEARTALVEYDAVRKALAADDLKATTAAAEKLTKLTAPPAAALATAAREVANAANLDTARAAFGPLAKAALTLASTDKRAAKGALAWQCPMAKGYQKWLQLDPDMANPYMGKKMLKCGGKVPVAP